MRCAAIKEVVEAVPQGFAIDRHMTPTLDFGSIVQKWRHGGGTVLSRLAPYRAAGNTGSAFLGCRWMVADCDGSQAVARRR